ncbi:hypothetical protein [Ornithinimicrobium kibberense]|uniref:hypothetical protein n=1 Tax=Ornithinimicrobium kibberense TaxID=282060 RepID=UPI00361AA85E
MARAGEPPRARAPASRAVALHRAAAATVLRRDPPAADIAALLPVTTDDLHETRHGGPRRGNSMPPSAR